MSHLFLKTREADALRMPWDALRAQAVGILRALAVPERRRVDRRAPLTDLISEGTRLISHTGKSIAARKLESRLGDLVRRKYPQFSLQPFTPTQLLTGVFSGLFAASPVTAG